MAWSALYPLGFLLFKPLMVRFAAFRAVENHPGGEVGREMLEMVRATRGNKEHRACLDCLPLGAIKEQTLSASNEIDFIP